MLVNVDILSQSAPVADHRIFYGGDPHQFGDLWLPQEESRVPLIVFFHGGWWKSQYNLEYAGHLCAAFKAMGIATWSVEYRRVGSTGGGWPTTFQDAFAGLNFVRTLAESYSLDLARIITMGHSAGALLAFWVTGSDHIALRDAFHLPPTPIELLGTVSLAGAVDLRLTIELAGDSIFAHDRQEVYALMGGPPELMPGQYQAGNPGDLLPLNVPQILIQGTEDDQIPPNLPERWADLARMSGDRVDVRLLPSADHFAVVDPASAAWTTVRDCVCDLLFHSK